MVSMALLLREPQILREGEYAAALEKCGGRSERNHLAVTGPLAVIRIDANPVIAAAGGRPCGPSKKRRLVRDRPVR